MLECLNLICRLCATSEENSCLFYIFDEEAESVEPFSVSLDVRICTLLNREIHMNDNRTNLICHRCLFMVNKFYLFKKACDEAEEKMNEIENMEAQKTSSCQQFSVDLQKEENAMEINSEHESNEYNLLHDFKMSSEDADLGIEIPNSEEDLLVKGKLAHQSIEDSLQTYEEPANKKIKLEERSEPSTAAQSLISPSLNKPCTDVQTEQTPISEPFEVKTTTSNLPDISEQSKTGCDNYETAVVPADRKDDLIDFAKDLTINDAVALQDVIFGNELSNTTQINVNSSDKNSKYICHLCSIECTHVSSMRRHLTLHSNVKSNSNNNTINSKTNSTPDRSRNKVKGFSCKYCDKCFEDNGFLVSHLKRVHQMRNRKECHKDCQPT